jgi:hypothetical protein
MALLPPSILPRNILTFRRANGAIQVSSRLLLAASVVPGQMFSELRTEAKGLTAERELRSRLTSKSPNMPH